MDEAYHSCVYQVGKDFFVQQMPSYEVPQPLDLVSVQQRVDELKHLHKFLEIAYEVRHQHILEAPMLRRVQDVTKHAPPAGVSQELWDETLQYYGEQKNFSNVL